VEAEQGTVEVIEGVVVEVVAFGKVTEVKECRDAPDNVNKHEINAQLKEEEK